jgi:hypothetical protein
MPLVIVSFILTLMLSSCVYQSQHPAHDEASLYGYNPTTLEVQQ